MPEHIVAPTTRLPAGAPADLVARVADDDIDGCLRMLAVSVIDVVGVAADPAVCEVLSQWREHGRVSPTTRSQLDAALNRSELEASIAHRAGDIDRQRTAFLRARSLQCLAIAIDPGHSPRHRLAEAAYEASIAMGASAGVLAVLMEFMA